jgi:hypothetical protein
MAPLPFCVSFRPPIGNLAFRRSQSGILRYDCRGLINTSSYPYSKFRASRWRVVHSFNQNLISMRV